MKRVVKYIIIGVICYVIAYFISKTEFGNSGFLGGFCSGLLRGAGLISIFNAVYVGVKNKKKLNK